MWPSCITNMRQATILRTGVGSCTWSFGLALCKAASTIIPNSSLTVILMVLTLLYSTFACEVTHYSTSSTSSSTLAIDSISVRPSLKVHSQVLPNWATNLHPKANASSRGLLQANRCSLASNRTWRSGNRNLINPPPDSKRKKFTMVNSPGSEYFKYADHPDPALSLATDAQRIFSLFRISKFDLPTDLRQQSHNNGSLHRMKPSSQHKPFGQIDFTQADYADNSIIHSAHFTQTSFKSSSRNTSGWQPNITQKSDYVLAINLEAYNREFQAKLKPIKRPRQGSESNPMMLTSHLKQTGRSNSTRTETLSGIYPLKSLLRGMRPLNILPDPKISVSFEQKHQHLSLMDSSRTIRMDQRRLIVVDQPETGSSRSILSSISDRSYSLGSVDRAGTNDTDEQGYPVLSFQYIEPHTIELLVVVTERMTQRFGRLINEYLLSLLTTVSSLLRHSSLKTSLQLKIVDIMQLDRNYAIRQNLDDWSYSKQEQVMSRFCRWVNRLRRPDFNWDSAILLNIGHFKSTALGVAHYRSMCSMESSCLAVLDRGFGTGYIIAHELGHQLGAKHDFEQNSDCGMEEQTYGNEYMDNTGDMYGASVDDLSRLHHYYQPREMTEFVRRDTIMSGTLYFDNFPLRWSACSRQAIHSFLEANAASCLRREDMPSALHTADWLAKRSHDDLPGSMFSLDQQCQFVLKVHATRFCGQLLPVCRQLYCQDADNGACLPMEAAWAEGSECGENKWCIQGQCVPTTQKPIRVNGNWGEWGPWSACSRTCGGGVRFSERECNNPEPANGGDFCHGTRTRMRSCAIQPCDKPSNIRQELCDEIGRQYGSHLGAYMPKLGEANACSLTCLNRGQAVHHGISLPDGTPCYSQRGDICIKGRCWETGCDGVLGSSQRFDQCRVCGGDNSSCVEIKGVYNGESVNSIGIQARGLINAVRIPRGVTNAFVRKVSPRTTPYSSDSYDDYMLLIFEELKTQIRRGETREPFVGAELYYSGTRRAEEIVSITGRLQKDVNIMIKLENTETTRPPPTVEYHYYVDKSQRHSPLYFIAEEEARLTSQQANRRAGRSHPASTVIESPVQPSSSPLSRSEPLKSTEPKPRRPRVHFVWRISELPSGCRTCAGNSTSYAECYPMVHDAAERQQFSDYDFYRPVADYLCASLPRPPPVVRRCADYCGVRWTTKPATSTSVGVSSDRRTPSTCSSRCGIGQQVVVHICEEYVVPAEEPDKSRGIWRSAQLGERACVKAGLGAAPAQPSYVPCEGKCEPVFWIATNWTECSSKCGHGERFRQIRCHDTTGREWPLNECMQSAESPGHSEAPTGAVSNKEAQTVLASSTVSDHITAAHLSSNLHLDQSEQCFQFSDECASQFRWSTSAWSECEPHNDEMRSVCRSIEHPDSRRKTIVGVRQRQVTCQLSGSQIPSTLQSYAIEHSSGMMDLWPMQIDLCRKASSMGMLQPEPNSREVCTQPVCYRWGMAQLSECSVTCGKGVRSATIPCERVTVDTTTLNTDPTHDLNVATWVEQVNLAECHQRLGYTPRIFLSHDSQSVFVETVDRPVQGGRLTQLTDVSLDQPIQLECIKERCTSTLPAWHTTPWSKCSVPCGTGVRKRQAICMLETHEQRPDTRALNTNGAHGRLEAFATVVTVNRLKTEVADTQLCHDHNLPKPVEEESCFEGPCPQWIPEEWGPCEGTCEYGIQRRNVRCVLDVLPTRSHSGSSHTKDDPSQALLFSVSDARHHIRMHRSVQSIDVDAERCHAVVPQPVTKRLCLISEGCPHWHKGDWSPCSVNCGIGLRVRQVDCRFPNGTRHQISDSSSLHFRSEQSRYAAERFERAIDEMTHAVENRFPSAYCNSPRPVDSASCKTRPCTQSQPFWWSLMVSECGSDTCEVGHRHRVIRCLSSLRGPIDDSACRYLQRPADWIPCVPFRCKKFEWRAERWNPCPRECGVRMRYRRVHCVDHLGEEYSDSLCPAHLKPDNWRVCPDRCSTLPKSCAEVKQRYPGALDGTYQLLVDYAPITVHCADMETVTPSEYIILTKVNYARTAAFMQPNFSASSSDYCPYNVQSVSYISGRQSNAGVPTTMDTTNEVHGRQLTTQEVSAANCPNCPFVPNLASATYFQKLRLDVNSMRVDIQDMRFAYTIGTSAVPFATAKDCFGSTTCPQGRFQIDLRGTGLRVSTKTRWEGSNEHVASHIHRSENGQLIVGRCGGNCAGCWPQPGLYLEVNEQEAKGTKIINVH